MFLLWTSKWHSSEKGHFSWCLTWATKSCISLLHCLHFADMPALPAGIEHSNILRLTLMRRWHSKFPLLMRENGSVDLKKKMETALKVSKLRYSTLIFFALHAHCFFCLCPSLLGFICRLLCPMTLLSIIFCSPTFLEVCTLRETGPWLYSQKSCRGTIHRVAILNKSTSFKQTTRSNTRYF